jgi:hypothetical protein
MFSIHSTSKEHRPLPPPSQVCKHIYTSLTHLIKKSVWLEAGLQVNDVRIEHERKRETKGVKKGGKLHNGELYNFYLSPDIVNVFKARRVKLLWPVAWGGEMKIAYATLVGKSVG